MSGMIWNICAIEFRFKLLKLVAIFSSLLKFQILRTIMHRLFKAFHLLQQLLLAHSLILSFTLRQLAFALCFVLIVYTIDNVFDALADTLWNDSMLFIERQLFLTPTLSLIHR